jgi:hypothetical protein
LAGADEAALTGVKETELSPKISYALDESLSVGRVVLHSKWDTGRRFELARLLGDRIAGNGDGQLFPATNSYTYRQKLQRSFEALRDMLHDDLSPEAIEDVGEHFDVSDRVVRTLLVNHGLLGRDELETDLDVVPRAA